MTCDSKVKPESRKDNGVVAAETENDKNDHGKQKHYCGQRICYVNYYLSAVVVKWNLKIINNRV